MECARRPSPRQEAFMRTIRRSFASLALGAGSLLIVVSPVPLHAADHAQKNDAHASTAVRSDVPSSHAGTERPARVRGASTHQADTAKVNINTADIKELMTLTGVGRKVAERIVE